MIAFMEIFRRKKLVTGFLVVNILAWIVYMVVQHFFNPTLRIKDYFSYNYREASLNNGRMNQSYLPIHDPVVVPYGFNNTRFLFIIIVSSSLTNIHKRNAIRETWGRAENWNFSAKIPLALRKRSYRTAFVIGTSSSQNITKEIRKEIAEDNDILLGSFEDSYKTLNLKVFMALKWSLSIDCKYILKADDDVYVNAPLLSMWLNNKNSRIPKDLYSGYVIRRDGPSRRKTSKFFISHRLYPQNAFPSWCTGLSYILSRDLASRILNASRVILPLWIEDVYMGMLVYYLGVRPLRNEGFRLRLSPVSSKELHSFNECFFLNTLTYGHKLGLKEMVYIHDIFRKMNSRSNSQLAFQCLSKDLTFTMSVVVPLLLLSVTGIAICVGVLRWSRWIRSDGMLKRTTATGQ